MEGRVVERFHGTRSYDRGIRDERTRSPARYRLAAKASAVQTGLRKCPCLARVLGSHRQRSHRGAALPDVDAQFEKFAVDAGCTPTGILPAHLAN
jgi:hypothetical protein